MVGVGPKFSFLFWNILLRNLSHFSCEKSVKYCPFLLENLFKDFFLVSSLPRWAFMSLPMISTICLGILQTKEDNSLKNRIMSVSSLALVELLRRIIVVYGLQLNEAHIILVCIFSMLFSDSKARGLITIPSSLMTALSEFSHADSERNFYPLSVSLYF